MKKSLPVDLTSYDLLKTAAVLLMIADHVGEYLYPDCLWLRVVGRFAAPIWLFLIGYAATRERAPRLWVGCALLVAGNFMAGMPLLPLNILGTIIIARSVIDRLMARPGHIWLITAALFALAWPTALAFEYGSLALILAMTGYILRHRPEKAPAFFTVAALIYIISQVVYFGFDAAQGGVLTLGMIPCMIALARFAPRTYPTLTTRLPRPALGVLRLCGRRTLEIYVVHLLLLKIAGMVYFPERFPAFDLKITPPALQGLLAD